MSISLEVRNRNYERALEEMPARINIIYNTILKSEKGLTNSEIKEKAGLIRNTASPITTYLGKIGAIRAVGKKKNNRNNIETIWDITGTLPDEIPSLGKVSKGKSLKQENEELKKELAHWKSLAMKLHHLLYGVYPSRTSTSLVQSK